MLEKLKSFKGPIGWLALILVVLFFWHPIWEFVIALSQKAEGLLGGK
jgi:hypothetical protein